MRPLSRKEEKSYDPVPDDAMKTDKTTPEGNEGLKPHVIFAQKISGRKLEKAPGSKTSHPGA